MRVINDTHRKFREALEELFYRLVWVGWSFMHMPLQLKEEHMSEHTTIPKGATVDISILEKPDPFQSCNTFVSVCCGSG